jgi:Tfp pilus assembly protein PilO
VLKDNIVKFNNPSRNAIFSALILVAAIAMYNWMVAPHVNYLFAVQRYRPVVSSLAREKELIAKSLDTNNEKLQEIKQQFITAQNNLFTDTEAKNFFANLESTAIDAGCALQSLSFSTNKRTLTFEKSQDALHIIANKARLSFTGSYDNIIALLNKFQTNPQKVWIDSFKLQISDIYSAMLRCDTTVTIYVAQNKEAIINE